MALQSVATTPEPVGPVIGEWVHSSNIIMRDMVLDIGISDGACGEETMRKYSQMMARWAKSILIVARARGDNEEDHPGTMDDALAGAEFFMHLADELREAAPKLRKGE